MLNADWEDQIGKIMNGGGKLSEILHSWTGH